MLRTILKYGIILAIVSLLLAWIEFGHFMRHYSTNFFVFFIALIFTIIGIYIGSCLTKPNKSDFQKNINALNYLGISQREQEVLALIAKGQPNKLIARSLEISPNTVKTHIANLFEKLGAQNRTQVIHNARALNILP